MSDINKQAAAQLGISEDELRRLQHNDKYGDRSALESLEDSMLAFDRMSEEEKIKYAKDELSGLIIASIKSAAALFPKYEREFMLLYDEYKEKFDRYRKLDKREAK